MRRHPWRVATRLLVFLWNALVALLDFFFRVLCAGRAADRRARAAWLQRHARRMTHGLRVQLNFLNPPPASGILVCNHLSYLDIAVLGAAKGMAFVSKSEVRSWPVIGALARCGGTLFINRERKADVVELGAQFEPVIQSGVVLCLFPEGTSSDGAQVLPFRPSLLEPAARHGWPVTPAHVRYRLRDGVVADEVCYWRDMTFGPHFLNLLSKERIEATVIFGEPLPPGLDRKEMARQLHAHVSEMSRREPAAIS